MECFIFLHKNNTHGITQGLKAFSLLSNERRKEAVTTYEPVKNDMLDRVCGKCLARREELLRMLQRALSHINIAKNSVY